MAEINTAVAGEKAPAVSGVRRKRSNLLAHPGSAVLKGLVWGAAGITFLVLLFLIGYILVMGIPNLSPKLFAWEYTTENVSMLPAIVTTVMLTGLSLLIAVPVGVFAAIFLVEYAGRQKKLVGIIRLTAETLSGIPSIVYGLFGMLFFVTALHWGLSVLSGSLTMAIMILPLIMRTTEEALKSVPDSYREASFGVGAGKLRTIFCIVLPAAVPGILAGVILGIGRIVGEPAALLYPLGSVAKVPGSLMDSGRTLAIHMYSLSSEALYMDQSYATAVVLIVLVLLINWLSAWVAKRVGAKG